MLFTCSPSCLYIISDLKWKAMRTHWKSELHRIRAHLAGDSPDIEGRSWAFNAIE